MATGTELNGLAGIHDPALIRSGGAADVAAVKIIADREKEALGFVHRSSLIRAAARDELVVACIGPAVVGFCQFYRRRDGVVTIYNVAVAPEERRQGIGRALLSAVGRDAVERGCQAVRLKCPAEIKANRLYAESGFALVAVEAGRVRPLNVWERQLASPAGKLGVVT